MEYARGSLGMRFVFGITVGLIAGVGFAVGLILWVGYLVK